MMHLPVRPIPIPGESAAGLLMRAVEKNGYPNLQSLIWAYWKNPGGIGWAKASFVNQARYAEIANAFGIKLPDDASPFYSRIGPTSESDRSFDGFSVPERLFRDDGRFYCPDCLREKAFWRKNWTVKTYNVCTQHNKILIKDCPVCGEQLDPCRGRVSFCGCGADLSSMESLTSEQDLFDWWISSHNKAGRQGQIIDAAILAIEEMDGGSDLPEICLNRLSAVKAWVTDGDVAPYLLKLFENRSHEIHPRIQILPLLKGAFPELHAFSYAILDKCKVTKPDVLEKTGRYLHIREGELSLGVSRSQFKKFIALGLVEAPDGNGRKNHRVSFDAINRILFDLQPEAPRDAETEGRMLTSSLASMVSDVMNGARESAGYDPVCGLATLKLNKVNAPSKEPLQNEDWLDINQISSLLRTYPDAIRFLVRAGKLSAKNRDLQGRKRLIAERAIVEKFNREFVFAGTLAKSLGLNATNLAEKLMSQGVDPISGPRIDGALVYLFRRDEAEAIDEKRLKSVQKYETKAGRKKKSDSRPNGQIAGIRSMSLSEAAKILEISVQQAKVLVSKNVLIKISSLNREVQVSKNSVRRLKRNLARSDLVSVEQAAAMFGMKPRSFQSLWINRGILKAYEFGLWRRIAINDLKLLREKLERKVTASEAGRLFSMHRSYLPNLERAGTIKSEIIAGESAIRLYSRSDLLGIQNQKKTSP